MVPHPAVFLFALGLSSCTSTASQQRSASGGVLRPEQAAYDVRHYDLELRVDPRARTIDGALTVQADVVAPLAVLLLDLDGALKVTRVQEGQREVPFVHEDGQLRIDLGQERAAGARLEVRVEYGGQPREAPNPPWDGGFTWAKTPSGKPWIATSCQTEGADLWWPCKDHPSDEPDAFDLHVTVPRPLIVASNGRLERVDEDDPREWTYHWSVSTPINTYCVALNIAPYRTVNKDYRSVTGETFPVTFWVLPEHLQQGRKILPQFLEHLRWFEETFGPYPFRADKYGVAETPHLGMEHQTIIAYGNEFQRDPWGYDWLHHHELAHEWWGNLVTARDWKDFWIHEGFGTYAQMLYTEHLQGEEAYQRRMQSIRRGVRSRHPVAPREPCNSREIYSNNVYNKGAWVLHTLRYLIGDEAFFESVRRMAYPDPSLEAVTDGSQCRSVDSAEIRAIAEQYSGQQLGWFFDVYLHQADLPELVVERRGRSLELRWVVPGDLSFPMPVEIRLGGTVRRVELPDGRATVQLPAARDPEVDPDHWILRS